METTLLQTGYGLVEAVRADSAGNLWFSDARRGGVFHRAADGPVRRLNDRPAVGGLVRSRAGGLVLSGRTVVVSEHGRDGVLLDEPGVTVWNDLEADAAGRVYVGAIRSNLRDLTSTDTPGECWRIDRDGGAEILYDGVALANGIGFAPDGRCVYHADSAARGVWVHDLDAGGAVCGRRLIGRAVFTDGIPDGLCVDVTGNLWIGDYGGGRVVQLDPDGALVSEVRLPCPGVTSVAFGGPDAAELYIGTAEWSGTAGSVYRWRPGRPGAITYPGL